MALLNGAGDNRLLYVAVHRLYSVDAATCKPSSGFGENGSVDFATGLSRDALDVRITATSPGIVHRDLLIYGSRPYNRAPGHIRTFTVRNRGYRMDFPYNTS